MSCRNGRVASGACNLVEIRDDVSRSINSVDRRALVDIDFKASHMIFPLANISRIPFSPATKDSARFWSPISNTGSITTCASLRETREREVSPWFLVIFLEARRHQSEIRAGANQMVSSP
jgi:hypothetical protein